MWQVVYIPDSWDCNTSREVASHGPEIPEGFTDWATLFSSHDCQWTPFAADGSGVRWRRWLTAQPAEATDT